MAYTPEQNKAFEDYLNENKIIAPTTTDLKTKIETWNSTASDNYAYNKATWNQQWAREVMLWSEWAKNMKTTVNAEEVKWLSQEWITNPNIVMEQPKPIQEAPIQEKTTTITPEWKTEVIKETPKPTWITKDTNWEDTDKSIWSLEQMVESRYWTIATQNPDWTLTATVWDKSYNWAIWPDWKPSKTEVQLSNADLIKNQMLSKYMTANSDQIYNGLVNWDITAEIKASLIANPNYAIAEEKHKKKISADNTNKMMKGMYNTSTWKTDEEEIDPVTETNNKIVANKIWKTDEELLDYSDFIAQDEDLTTNVKDLSAKNLQLKELNQIAKDRYNDIEKKYPWLDKNSAILLASRQNESIYNQIDALSDEIANLQANVTYREKILDKEYNTKLSQQQLEEQRAYEQSQTEEQRSYNEQLQTKQLEQEYAYTYWDLNSENPTLQNIAIERAVADLYTKYPLSWMESQAMKVQKVKDRMAQGMTWSEAIASLESEIRKSDRYKTYIDEQSKWQEWKVTYWKVWVDSTWKDIYWFIDTANKTISWTSWNLWTTPTWWTTTAQPTWNLVTRKIGNTNATRTLDEVAMNSFDTVASEMAKAWIKLVVWSSYRTKEEQQKLYDNYIAWKWWIAAKPWESKHESWMAIDIYSDNKLSWPTQAQIDIMTKNWFKHMAIPWDLWHFEYVWKQSTWDLSTLWQFMKDNQDRWVWYSNDDVTAFNNKIDRMASVWDEKWMAVSYRKMLMDDKTFKKEFDDTTVFAKSLDTVEKLISDYEKAGKSTNAAKALAEKVWRKLWITTDTALAQLQTQLWVTMANYIRSISWTAASDVEVQRLMGNMANIGNIKDLNTAIVWQVKSNAMNWIKQMIDNRMYWMPEDLKPKVFWDIYWKTKPNEVLTSTWKSWTTYTFNPKK